MGADHWQVLPHPVPGHSTGDGLPVPVVAVRRHGLSGQLEVIRGLHPTAEWPRAEPPPGSRRHLVSAASFNPHPPRELVIQGDRFSFSTLPNSVRCRSCGVGDIGFGFVSPEASPAGTVRSAVGLRTLCEPCAEWQARVSVQ
ncbi:MAG: hypothetical protein ABSA40_01750 [Candidatus Dormibacteria bacterium]